jgi:hypothetical protein
MLDVEALGFDVEALTCRTLSRDMVVALKEMAAACSKSNGKLRLIVDWDFTTEDDDCDKDEDEDSDSETANETETETKRAPLPAYTEMVPHQALSYLYEEEDPDVQEFLYCVTNELSDEFGWCVLGWTYASEDDAE